MKRVTACTVISVFICAITFTARAANLVTCHTTSEAIRKAACEKAGSLAFTFDSGSVLTEGDWWYADLPIGVTLCCTTIDYEIANGPNTAFTSAHPANGTTLTYGTPGVVFVNDLGAAPGVGGITVTGGVVFRVSADVGGQRVLIMVMGTTPGLDNLTVDPDTEFTLKILDGQTNPGFMFKNTGTPPNGIYGDNLPADNLVAGDNALCIDARQLAGNYVNVSYDSRNDVFTFTGDNEVAHYLAWPPTAGFSASPRSGYAPLNVDFYDQSGGYPTSWLWSFGDGETSAQQNPSHLYQSPGSYTVALTVANVAGTDSDSLTDFIRVRALEPAAIRGIVSDAFTEIGIGGATVVVTPGNLQSMTNSLPSRGEIGSYSFAGLTPGTYTVSVSAPGYQSALYANLPLSSGLTRSVNAALAPLQLTKTIKMDIGPACAETGSPIAISVPSSTGGHLYRYFVNTASFCDGGTPVWQLIRDWTTERSITYSPSSAGKYTFVVWTGDDLNQSCPSLIGLSYGVGETECADSATVSLTPASGAVNEPVTIQAQGSTADLNYSFWVNAATYDCSGGSVQWVLLQDWSSSSTFTYTPTEAKAYTFVVRTSKDPINNPCYRMAGMTYAVQPAPVEGEGYWSFNETGGSVVYDTSGFGNDGLVYGAAGIEGVCAKALRFGGSADCVEIPDHPSLRMPGGITIEAWVRMDALPSDDYAAIVSKDTNGELRVTSNGSLQALVTNEQGSPTVVTGRTTLPTGIWRHVAMTCEANGNLKLYADGVDDGSTPFSGRLMSSSASFRIGRDHTAPGRFFGGAIDEVHIYGRPLTLSQIRADQSCTMGSIAGLVTDAETGEGIGQVTVTVLPGNLSAVTQASSPFSSAGSFKISNIPAGTYSVIASKQDFFTNYQTNVVIMSGETTTINLSLSPR